MTIIDVPSPDIFYVYLTTMTTTITNKQSPAFLYVAIPAYGCLVTVPFVLTVLELQAICIRNGIGVVFDILAQESLITRARNMLCARFLAEERATHLLFLDADLAFDPALILKMVRADRDVISSIYSKKVRRWEKAAAMLQKHPDMPRATLESATLDFNINVIGDISVNDGIVDGVHDAATGCLLMKRSVLERMCDHYKDTLTCVNDIAETRGAIPTYVAIFETMIDPVDKRYLSEDYAFVRRWQALDGTVSAVIDYPMRHGGLTCFRGEPLQRFTMTFTG
jgi:hypothetical protein